MNSLFQAVVSHLEVCVGVYPSAGVQHAAFSHLKIIGWHFEAGWLGGEVGGKGRGKLSAKKETGAEEP